MELSYTLSAEDYLELQLYNLSRDGNYRKQRNRDRFRLPGLSLLFGAILLFDGMNNILACIFMASSVLFFIFYPQWSAWFYRRMCKRKINENMKDDSLYHVKLLLGNDIVEIDSMRGHNYFNVHDISCVVEVGKYFFMMMNQYVCVIVPKKQIVEEEQLSAQFENYKENKGVRFVQEPDWKWQ
jgi:hypothetical protein